MLAVAVVYSAALGAKYARLESAAAAGASYVNAGGRPTENAVREAIQNERGELPGELAVHSRCGPPGSNTKKPFKGPCITVILKSEITLPLPGVFGVRKVTLTGDAVLPR